MCQSVYMTGNFAKLLADCIERSPQQSSNPEKLLVQDKIASPSHASASVQFYTALIYPLTWIDLYDVFILLVWVLVLKLLVAILNSKYRWYYCWQWPDMCLVHSIRILSVYLPNSFPLLPKSSSMVEYYHTKYICLISYRKVSISETIAIYIYPDRSPCSKVSIFVSFTTID